MDGYISLHRKLLENPVVCKDAEHLAVWVWLLLKATWKESDVLFNGKRIALRPGDLPPISRKTISSELQISESKVQRILKSFENEHQIEQQMGSHSRLISICSWDKYQLVEPQSKPQVNTKRTPTEQQLNTIEKLNKVNKGNKVNLTNSQILNEFDEVWGLYPRKQGKKAALAKYQKARKEGTTFEEVKEGIEAYNAYIKSNDIDYQFIKQGSAFFNQRAWNDDWSPRNIANKQKPYQPRSRRDVFAEIFEEHKNDI